MGLRKPLAGFRKVTIFCVDKRWPAEPSLQELDRDPLPTAHLGDHPALNLLNSVAALDGGVVDFLPDGAALLRWFGATMADGGQPVERSPAGEASPAQLDEVTAEVRALREWLRGFVARHAGRPLPPDALREAAPLNRLLADDMAFRQLIPAEGGAGIVWSAWTRRDPRRMVLEPFAQAVGDLLTGSDFRRIRACGGLGCTLWFLDRTKANSRRWCSMALCGNRSKAREHRERRRAQVPRP